MARDWHEKPPADARSVGDALRSADQKRRDLPLIVQVRASDWDEVILADEVYRLRQELEWSAKRWKAAMEERGWWENKAQEYKRRLPHSHEEH